VYLKPKLSQKKKQFAIPIFRYSKSPISPSAKTGAGALRHHPLVFLFSFYTLLFSWSLGSDFINKCSGDKQDQCFVVTIEFRYPYHGLLFIFNGKFGLDEDCFDCLFFFVNAAIV
jgi:hypothetical protein